MFDDRYDDDPIARAKAARAPRAPRAVPVRRGLELEEGATSFYGEVVDFDAQTVTLRDFDGAKRVFPFDSRFLLDDAPVRLARGHEQPAATRAPARSASGSVYVENARARTALPSRIFVEGRHDAELVEKVWGHDLRIEGVAVEYLGGIDDLEGIIERFAPTPKRRVGVLVDHLVPGTKESRIAEGVMRGDRARSVLIVGHPYIDIWAAVKPERIGREAWPTVPRGEDWKHGICARLGWPHADQADIARAWQRILGQVRTYRDLEPELLRYVEELIDFVTEPTAVTG